MLRLSVIHGKNVQRERDRMRDAVRDGVDFTAASLRGVWVPFGDVDGFPGTPPTGRLPEQWCRILSRDVAWSGVCNPPPAADGPGRGVYVIYSRATPVAWFVDGWCVIPDVKYSVSTTRQQGVIAVTFRDWPQLGMTDTVAAADFRDVTS